MSHARMASTPVSYRRRIIQPEQKILRWLQQHPRDQSFKMEIAVANHDKKCAKRKRESTELAEPPVRYLQQEAKTITSILLSSNSTAFKCAEEWRDRVRRSIGVAKLQVDFHSIDYAARGIVVDSGTLYDSISPTNVVAWPDFRTRVKDASTIQVTYAVQPLHVEEGEEYPYEFDGIPTAIATDIILNAEGDVEDRTPPRVMLLKRIKVSFENPKKN